MSQAATGHREDVDDDENDNEDDDVDDVHIETFYQPDESVPAYVRCLCKLSTASGTMYEMLKFL